MKRDMDLARKILLETEKHQKPDEPLELQFEGHSPKEVAYHVKLLAQAGLIEAFEGSRMGAFEWWPTSLTWNGHEFLDAARDDQRWTKAKARIGEKGLALSFDLLKFALTEGMRHLLT